MILLLSFKVGWTNSQTQCFRSYLSPNVHDSEDSGTAFPASTAGFSHVPTGWEEFTDSAVFALLRDKLQSGKVEQTFELKDTQRLKKHLQQVGVFVLYCSKICCHVRLAGV
jgi:hypothetical protein